jgi:formiminotetrahydrofolate cyclodeaminase
MMNSGPLVPDLTEVMDKSTYSGYHDCVKDFGVWLHDLSTAPLPGGVAAAAVAAAMGAALLAKATRVTLRRQAVDETGRTALEAVLDLACDQLITLMHLAEVDERAYRAVLEVRKMPASSMTRREAWLEATEAPIRVAEACQSLLDRSSQWLDPCWPPVEHDLQTGRWLLETGVRAGLLAAEGNIRSCGDGPETESSQMRIDELKSLLPS